MAASILIVVLSFGLIAYWLRYTCLLLLGERQAEEVAAFPMFHFERVREEAQGGACDAKLRAALDRDYAVLTHLIGRTAMSDIEARLLVWDYRIMRIWHALTRTAFPGQARKALTEMADVLGVLARKLREDAESA